jgi:hypothetical protein
VRTDRLQLSLRDYTLCFTVLSLSCDLARSRRSFLIVQRRSAFAFSVPVEGYVGHSFPTERKIKVVVFCSLRFWETQDFVG